MKLKLSLDVIYEVSPEVIKELEIEFGSRDDVMKELYSRLEQELVGYFAEEIHEDLLEETEVSFDSTTTKIYSVELLDYSFYNAFGNSSGVSKTSKFCWKMVVRSFFRDIIQ